MPWKNGGGVTRELLRLEHPTDPARFLARLSIATVAESGPFSVFPGVDRTIMLLEGTGMALSVNGEPEVVLAERWQPFPFPGEAQTQCRLLDGTVRDFNLMVDRAVASATFELVRLAPGEARTLAGAEMLLLHALQGRASVDDESLAAEDTLWLRTTPSLTLRGHEAAVVVAIHLTSRVGGDS